MTVLAVLSAGGLDATAARAAGSHPGAHRGDPVVAVAARTEGRPLTASGRLERIHGHRARDRGSVAGWMLTTDRGRRIPLSFRPGARPRAGSRVRVRGVRRGAALRVRSLRRLPQGATARAAVAPTGAKRTAVILFNFTDDRSQPFSVEQVRSALFTGSRSVSAFYSAESRQRLSLRGRDRADGDIYGWHEIDASATRCFGGSNWDWYSKADAAVRAAGASLSGYDHVVYVHPKTSACRFAGIATLGGGFSSLNGTISLWVAGHEMGHNYEFEHAGKAFCTDAQGRPASISRSCTVSEYDDPYDIMGNRFQRHSSGIWQLQAGWIPRANLRTVTSSGTHTLAPLAETVDAPQVLRIPRGAGRSYWLEFRRPHGAFDDFALTEPVVSGVTIRLAGDLASPGVTELIDTNPESGRSVRDEALAVGRTFTDSDHQIRITTEAAGAAGARVAVHLGPPAQVDTTGTASEEPTIDASPAPAPPAGSGGTDGGDTARVSERRLPVRALVGRRLLPVARLAAADGRALSVASRRAPIPLELRFGLAAGDSSRPARLELRLSSPRRCQAEVSVRSPAGRWVEVALVRTTRRWRTHAPALAAAHLRETLDVRVACRGSRHQLGVDAAAVKLS